MRFLPPFGLAWGIVVQVVVGVVGVVGIRLGVRNRCVHHELLKALLGLLLLLLGQVPASPSHDTGEQPTLLLLQHLLGGVGHASMVHGSTVAVRRPRQLGPLALEQSRHGCEQAKMTFREKEEKDDEEEEEEKKARL